MAKTKVRNISVDLDNIDWVLLRLQKLWLLEVVDFEIDGDTAHGDGLIAFIDHVQDEAASQLGEDTVFGEKCPECGEFQSDPSRTDLHDSLCSQQIWQPK